MLTHQSERPEKCPIQTCDYHNKGFARKYDKDRHTLAHYEGTIVCGFCEPELAANKSFNRVDSFKKHFTSVHPTKKTSGGDPGKCSTCSNTFSNAQEFYKHLDNCIMLTITSNIYNEEEEEEEEEDFDDENDDDFTPHSKSSRKGRGNKAPRRLTSVSRQSIVVRRTSSRKLSIIFSSRQKAHSLLRTISASNTSDVKRISI
jgi:hypothetical protein